MPKLKQSKETTIINKDGEILTKIKNRTLSWGAEPSYIKLYLQDVLYFSDMPSKHAKILYALLKRASYAGDKNGMQVTLSSGLKRIIIQELNMKNIGSIDNALTDLTKGKILYRVETGVYNFNPWLFGKGDWQDISKLRMEVDYNDIKGRTFKAVCDYQKEPPVQVKPKKEEPDIVKDQIPLITEEDTPPIANQAPEQKHQCKLCGKELILNKKGDKYYCPDYREKDENGERKCKGTFVNVEQKKAS